MFSHCCYVLNIFVLMATFSRKWTGDGHFWEGGGSSLVLVLKWRSFIVLLKYNSSVIFRKISVLSPTYQQSVSKRYQSDKHLSEFYLQDGGKNQLAQI